jgi:nucleoside phosphorylase
MCALKAEAQAFIDRYKLSKTKQNSDIKIIVSGIGTKNMFDKTKLVTKEMQTDDIIINVGICGASKKYEIGQLIDADEKKITCIDYEAKDAKFDIVDMESDGFLSATKDVKNSFIFKVVSDHFEPHKVTKEKTKSLIFNVINDINSLVYKKVNT